VAVFSGPWKKLPPFPNHNRSQPNPSPKQHYNDFSDSFFQQALTQSKIMAVVLLNHNPSLIAKTKASSQSFSSDYYLFTNTIATCTTLPLKSIFFFPNEMSYLHSTNPKTVYSIKQRREEDETFKGWRPAFCSRAWRSRSSDASPPSASPPAGEGEGGGGGFGDDLFSSSSFSAAAASIASLSIDFDFDFSL